MIKITRKEDIQNIPDKEIISYIQTYLGNLLTICFPDHSIEAVGEIFFLESVDDFKYFGEIGLSSPLKEERFEWIDSVDKQYSNGCIVLNNSRAVNLIGRTEYFKEVFGME